MDNFLINIALASSFYEEKRNPLDTYFPFVLNAFVKTEIIELKELSDNLKSNFKIDIPLYSIKNIINRNSIFSIKKESKTKWFISLTSNGKDELNRIKKSEKEIINKLTSFYNKFIEFTTSKFKVKYQTTDTENNIHKFIINNLVDISIEQLGLTIENDKHKEFEKHFILFLNYIKQNEFSLVEIFDDLWKGVVIWNEIRKDDLPKSKSSFEKNIKIYVDTNFIISLLGYHNPIINQAVQELFDLISDHNNLSLYILDITLDEIFRLLDLYPIIKDNFFDIEIDSLFYFLKKQGYTSAKIEIVKRNLKNDLLKKYNIKTINKSSLKSKETEIERTIYDHLFEIRKERNKKRDERVRKSEEAIKKSAYHDSSVITNTLKFKNKYSTNLEDSKSIFLTSSFWLYHNYKKIHKKFEYFPSVVYDATLTNILYLKTPKTNVGISIYQVLKTHCNYLIIDNNIWFQFIDIAKDLIKEGDIDETDYAVLISKNIYTQEFLLNSKQNDINKDSIKSTLNKIKKEKDSSKIELDKRADIIQKKNSEIENKDSQIKILSDKIDRIDRERIYEKKIKEYNRKLTEFCDSKWTEESKLLKKHFWNYLLFIIITVFIIFILVAFRNIILGLFNIQITDSSKLYYAGIITAVGFIATAIRSFFDKKNIIKGLRIIILKKSKKEIKKSSFEKSKETYKNNNKEPVLDE